MQSFISILLAVTMAMSVSGSLAGVTQAGPDSAAAPAVQPAAPAAAAAEVPDWEDIEYTHYDSESYYAMTDRLTELAGEDDAQAVIALYDRLYDEYVRIDTLSAVAYIHSGHDLTDEYWMEESTYCDTLAAQAYDALCTACHAITEGPCADAFEEHMGRDSAMALAEYVPLTDRESELLARESELVDEYYQLMNDQDDLTYSYLGRTWTWDMVTGFQGSSLASQDYDGYLEVYYGLQKALNDQVGPVFLELVQLRAELAEIEGWDSYTDMAYSDVFARDYTAEDAQALCDAVKAVSRRYYTDELYYSDLWYASDMPEPAMDADALVEVLGRYAGELEPSLAESWQVMTEHGLYDLSPEADRMPGAYTITLSEYGAPFIFATLTGDCNDLATLSHEFGHFAYDRRTPCPNLLTYVGSYDLMEIPSTALETLFTFFYDDIYDTGADAARFNILGGLFESVLDGCIFDEFQRAVYARPDMTLEEMNRLFADIEAQYGLTGYLDEDYEWMYVAHTFETPLYYISYAASALATIQIWSLAREDMDAGVQAWQELLDHSAYEEDYLDVLTACGLRTFTEEGAVADICRPLLRELARLDAEA